ncbi:hypothetical protein ACHAP8_010781 [Fusarium lateritium]
MYGKHNALHLLRERSHKFHKVALKCNRTWWTAEPIWSKDIKIYLHVKTSKGMPRQPSGHIKAGTGLQQYDDPIDSQGRVTLPDGHRPFDDPRRRTAHFVDSGQHPGTRYASYAGDTEQRAITSAARAITHFEMQFSHGANLNASAQDVLQGGTPWPYPQRIDPNYRDYPPAVECANHNGKYSRARRW